MASGIHAFKRWWDACSITTTPTSRSMIRGAVVDTTHEGGPRAHRLPREEERMYGHVSGRAPGEQRVIVRVRPDHVSDS
jgi:hypothetical protein